MLMSSQPQWGDSSLPHPPGLQDHEDDGGTDANTLLGSESHKEAERGRPAGEPLSSEVSPLCLS